MIEQRIHPLAESIEAELERLREQRPALNGRLERAEHLLVSQLSVPAHVRPVKVKLSGEASGNGHTYRVRSGSKLSTTYTVEPETWSCECRWAQDGDHDRYGRACCHVLACWILERVSRKAAPASGGGEQEQQAECQNCGERKPRRAMVSVEDDDHLTWFGGEVLCTECAKDTGVEIRGAA